MTIQEMAWRCMGVAALLVLIVAGILLAVRAYTRRTWI